MDATRACPADSEHAGRPGAGSRLSLDALVRESESRSPVLLRGAMLHEARHPRARPRLRKLHDRLRGMREHVPAEREEPSRLDVRVHLGRRHDRDPHLPGHPHELRDLAGELLEVVPPGLLPLRETVWHRRAVDYDEPVLGVRIRYLHRLLDQDLLLVERVRLREQDVLRDDLEVVPAHLLEPLHRHALRVDVDHLLPGPHDVPRELEADVRLAAPRLSEEEGDAPSLEPASEEIVDGPRSERHPHRSQTAGTSYELFDP